MRGCTPRSAVVPATGRQPQQQQPKQKRGSCGMAGWVRLRGPLQVRPCKLGRRIRCKYVHVSSVAASMRLTPPQPDPPRLRQVPAAVGGC
ncbi:hypothetical protein TEP_09930 [Stenotrophomonas sp. TEPEL]|nr:hypothetical protein TEP_09930 [Stenotrophomonas sp. TEPEL]